MLIHHSNKRLLRAVTQFTLYRTNGLLAFRADQRQELLGAGAPCSRSGPPTILVGAASGIAGGSFKV